MAEGLLAGKTALITGGAQGLGRAILDGFAAAGARGLVLDLAPPADPCRRVGIFVAADVAKESDIEAACRQAADKLRPARLPRRQCRHRPALARDRGDRSGGMGPGLRRQYPRRHGQHQACGAADARGRRLDHRHGFGQCDHGPSPPDGLYRQQACGTRHHAGRRAGSRPLRHPRQRPGPGAYRHRGPAAPPGGARGKRRACRPRRRCGAMPRRRWAAWRRRPRWRGRPSSSRARFPPASPDN